MVKEDEYITVRLENSALTFSIAKKSVIGNRKEQQDSAYFETDGERAVAVICDGMGGKEGGRQASSVASKFFLEDMLQKSFDENLPRVLQDEMERLDEKVVCLKDKKGNMMSAGTTLVGIVLDTDRLWYVSVGDSRLYRCRNGKLQCLTTDHNYELILREHHKQGYLDSKEFDEAIQEKKTQALISYLGIGRKKRIDISEEFLEMKEGDRLLLCSDGLYKALYPEQIQAIVSDESEDVESIANRLIQVATTCAVNDQDNTTVIVADFFVNQ